MAGCTDKPPGVIPTFSTAVPATAPETSTTTTEPAEGNLALPPVPGRPTTTAVSLGPGGAGLTGRVEGPEGPVGAAAVRVERLVGPTSVATVVGTGSEGQWQIRDIKGGSYLVRAWRAPDLASSAPLMLFLREGEVRALTVPLVRHGGITLSPAVAPDPPPLVGPANVAVRFATMVVVDGGELRLVPQPNLEVSLSVAGGFVLQSPAAVVTDAGGTARWQVYCLERGGTLTVNIGPTDIRPLALPTCGDPPRPRGRR